MAEINDWVRDRYRAFYCDETGRQCTVYLSGPFIARLKRERPSDAKIIKAAVKIFDDELFRAYDVNSATYLHALQWAEREHVKHVIDKDGRLQDRAAALSSLASLDVYLHPRLLEVILRDVVNRAPGSTTRSSKKAEQRTDLPEASSSSPLTRTASSGTDCSQTMSNKQLKTWVQQKFREQTTQAGFKEDAFAKSLVEQKPAYKKKIYQFVAVIRQQGQKKSQAIPDTSRRSERDKAESEASFHSTHVTQRDQLLGRDSSPAMTAEETSIDKEPVKDPWMMGSVHSGTPVASPSGSHITAFSSRETHCVKDLPTEIDYSKVHLLRADAFAMGVEDGADFTNEEIRHAPLVSAAIIDSTSDHVLPHVGYLGECTSGITSDPATLFLNANIPFSALVCGVQGSGKSHTVSCFLENALIPSPHLGRLKTPLSALVFHYGRFTSAFKISESVFLASPHPDFPVQQHMVKKITVLVPPSNPALAKLYQEVPNVRVLPFRLKTRSLDINTMLTLMAVDGSSTPPLYLASVTKLLRKMAMEGSGEFDYMEFKARLRLCQFNASQSNMLELRMDLLESFLDLDGSCEEPTFLPGEVTIVDMSCPFVESNTACVMFGIALQNYLRSKAKGKMIVLDEAHKYMLNNPGAQSLNDDLARIIRLQRHYGTRVVISTQEPVLLADLIALCSISIVHRFSSPEWHAALRKHIQSFGKANDSSLEVIESLRTGDALVYAPNAVLCTTEDGNLEKGMGRLLKVSVRKRITADGGRSVLCNP